jgi:hypothetical protein
LVGRVFSRDWLTAALAFTALAAGIVPAAAPKLF